MTKKLKQYLYNEFTEYKKGLTLAEYIAWWAVRLCMVGAVIYKTKAGDDPFQIMLIEVNLGMTFAIPFMRLVFFKKIFLGKLPLRIQDFIDIFVFFGSFLGHGLNFCGTVEDYDKILHLVSGGMVVFIGYLIITSVKGGKEMAPSLAVIGAGGFSSLVMIVWEVFEFFSDHFLKNSNNQNLYFTPNGNVFFKIFGYGAGKPQQYPVLDTNIDIVIAMAGCLLCMAVLYGFLMLRAKSRAK